MILRLKHNNLNFPLTKVGSLSYLFAIISNISQISSLAASIGSLSNLTDACQEILHMFDEGTKQNTSV
jgi:hypothetical protein